MNSNIENDIQRRLFTMQDTAYQRFHSKLMPTVDPSLVIGVRTPLLRKLAAELAGTQQAEDFMKALPHKYYEENNLHAFLIESIKDYHSCINALNAFLPFVDNWATCDSMAPKVLRCHLPELLIESKKWLASEHTYTVRYGIGVLMKYFLDDEFSPEYAQTVADIQSDEYYINMMRAWYFATALAKQYDCAVKYLEKRVLDSWTHSRTIQKAVESFRVSPEHKEYIRSLR